MGRRCTLAVGLLALAAAACGDASGADHPTSPPTTGTTITYLPVAGSPPIDPPEWFPVWDDPALVPEPPVGNAFSAVATGPGGLVAHGVEWGDQATIAHIAFSADGADWAPVAAFPGHLIAAIEGGGPGYVAVGGRYLPSDAHDDASLLEPAAWWSADGRSWQEATVDLPADAGVPATFRLADYEIRDGSWIEDVVFDGEVGLAVGRSAGGARNVIWTSGDGKAWTEVDGTPLGGPAHVGSITPGVASYLAWGAENPRGHDPGKVALWHSRDGVAWDQVASFDPLVEPAPWWNGVVRLRGGFLALGAQGHGRPVGWVSTDGVEWSPPHALPAGDGATVRTVASNGDLVVAVGSELSTGEHTVPVVWMSEDGIRWAKHTPAGQPPESAAEAITWLHDHWFVLGRAWDLPGGEISGFAWRGR